MEKNSQYVEKQIERNNHWYTGSQFEWAESIAIKRIYLKRYNYFKTIIEQEIVKKSKVRVLDCGCGDGYWSLLLSQIPNCSVVGVDYNPLRLERAKAIAVNAQFVQVDLMETKNHLGKFDIILCSQVIEHILDDVAFLKKIKSFLEDDGRLILGTPNEGCFTQQAGNFSKGGETDHCHFYTEKEIIGKLNEAGFVVKDVFREVFYPGHYGIYYKLTSSDLGFKFLEFCTRIMPSQCSDYYFDCIKSL